MIDVIFRFGTDVVIVRVNGHSVTFGNKVGANPMMAPIEGLQLSRSGVVKEFPELENSDNWRLDAIAKFKDKIRDLDNELLITQYVIDDLSKWGYIPIYKQRAGFRIEQLGGTL